MTQTLTLEAKSPAWLAAKIDTDAARKLLKAARSRPGEMTRRNELHADEIANATRRGAKPNLLTVEQARHTGLGNVTVVYHARHDDPAQTPYSESDFNAQRERIGEAARVLEDAERRLEETPASFDVFDAARDAGAGFVWWPTRDGNIDPRRHRYRGKAISDDELAELGPHKLRQQITAGTIVEVPS